MSRAAAPPAPAPPRARPAADAPAHAPGGGALAARLAFAAPAPRHAGAPPLLETLRRAGTEAAGPLDSTVRERLEAHLGEDLGGVRVHAGPASAAAADRVGARAYTLGRDIHLGSEGRALAGEARERLLAHEAVHTLQQGGRAAAPGPGTRVAGAAEPAEAEAARVADEAFSPAPADAPRSRSLALRDRMRGGAGVSPLAGPAVQRDLNKTLTTLDGTFTTKLKTEAHAGAKNGMSGTIEFTPSATAPDSKSIRLLQIARDEDLTTGKEYVWTGDEANRNKIMTTEDKATGVEPGYFVDVIHKNRTPRTAKTDPAVSPYYIDDYLALKDPNNRDGSKQGKTVASASLWDYPGSSGNRRFSFETAAKAADTGYIYATLRWGFTISDAAKGKVEQEHASAHYVQSSTFNAAVKAFDTFYKNPGSANAP